MSNRTIEVLEAEPIFDDAFEITGSERMVALGLLLAGLVMPSLCCWFMLEHLNPFSLQAAVGVVLLVTYVFCVIETFGIIVLWGLKRLSLPPKFVPWLGGATIGEVAGMLYLVVQFLYRRGNP